jgi:hypothetical protein
MTKSLKISKKEQYKKILKPLIKELIQECLEESIAEALVHQKGVMHVVIKETLSRVNEKMGSHQMVVPYHQPQPQQQYATMPQQVDPMYQQLQEQNAHVEMSDEQYQFYQMRQQTENDRFHRMTRMTDNLQEQLGIDITEGLTADDIADFGYQNESKQFNPDSIQIAGMSANAVTSEMMLAKNGANLADPGVDLGTIDWVMNGFSG